MRRRRGVGDRAGSPEAFLAWSDEPLPKGAKVLVVDDAGRPHAGRRALGGPHLT